jgi:mannosyl-oligosaccharide alpha-1,2-mannosidase
MFRLRRYRVFVLFAALTIFCIYRFGNPRNWEAEHGVDVLKEHLGVRGKSTQSRQQGGSQEILGTKAVAGKAAGVPPVQVPAAVPGSKDAPKSGGSLKKGDGALKGTVSPPPVAAITKPVQKAPPPAKETELPTPVRAGDANQKGSEAKEGDGRMRVLPHPPKADAMAPILEQGSGRWDSDQLPLDVAPIRWVKPVEHFPVSTTIQLPTGKPSVMPRIQYDFSKKQESDAVRKDRREKRDMVKEAFLHAWKGYKEKAWGKDELMPVSGGSKNPFSGWGATLVDSLDTMWIMGLKAEFEEAVEWVKDLDFKSSRRGDIPIFETTIRYLGGLLGAYDVSEGKHKILLDKAVELAEIMIGAFDTPNRMPDTFYQWKP